MQLSHGVTNAGQVRHRRQIGFGHDPSSDLDGRIPGGASCAVRHRHEGWAKAAREAIAAAPPFLTALTLKLLRENRHCDLREALIRDYRVAVRLLSGAGRSAADPQMLAGMLASLGSDDLKLPTRAEMQAPAL